MNKKRLSNSSADVSFFEKLIYNFTLFRMRMRGGNEGSKHANQRYDEIKSLVADFEHETGHRAIDSTIIEIGFGARPERAFAFTAFYNKVIAIDLDAPVLSFRDIFPVFRKNGLERGLKSLIRHILFDSRGWKTYHRQMKKLHPAYNPAKVKFLIGNAGSPDIWAGIDKADIIFSTDVFEHIPKEDLQSLMHELYKHIFSHSIIVTIPMVFTGISGGHDLEWYPHQVEMNISSTAWGHLLIRDFQPNTYINKLSRREYVDIYEKAGFKVVRDEAMRSRLGEKHLTPEKKELLSAFDDYELFSNNVYFLLKIVKDINE
jgi:hypothetical protein